MRFPSLLLVAAAVTPACGESLVSGASLEGLIGTTAPTVDAAWEYRWGTEDGLVADCALVNAGVTDSVTVVVGQIKLPLPVVTVADAPVWQQLDGAEYVVLLPVLVESAVYEPVEEDEDEGSLDPEEGVWGITAPTAMVLARGDQSVVSQHLVFDGAPPLDFDGDVAWVQVISEVIELRGTLAGALAPLDQDDLADLLRDGITVTSVQFALSDASEAWSGETLGGVRPADDCPEDEDNDE